MPKGVYERTEANKPKPRIYPKHIVELICDLYRSGMTVAEVRAVAPKGYRVQTILERHLDERRPAAKREQRGPMNHMWAGSDCGYAAAHLRLRQAFGPASSHVCADCAQKAADWSYSGGCESEREDAARGLRYCTHLDHYVPRCRPCHRTHDLAQPGARR